MTVNVKCFSGTPSMCPSELSERLSCSNLKDEPGCTTGGCCWDNTNSSPNTPCYKVRLHCSGDGFLMSNSRWYQHRANMRISIVYHLLLELTINLYQICPSNNDPFRSSSANKSCFTHGTTTGSITLRSRKLLQRNPASTNVHWIQRESTAISPQTIPVVTRPAPATQLTPSVQW